MTGSFIRKVVVLGLWAVVALFMTSAFQAQRSRGCIREGRFIVKPMLVLLLVLTGFPTLAQTPAAFDAAQAERDVMAVLDEFMAAFNRKDAVGEERTYHFPHYRLASGRMTVHTEPGPVTQAALNAAYKSLLEFGWDHSSWSRRRIIHISDAKVHVDTQFTRYRSDGSVLGKFDSLYILTKENGRWGIKMRSSFAQ